MDRRRPATAVRIVLAVVGGYVLTSELIVLTAMALIWGIKFPKSEAVLLASMLGFIAYLVILLWAFAERSLVRFSLRLCLVSAAAYGLIVLLMRNGA